jgi:carbon-monoxide dehydrogenase medium subunit
MTPFTFHRPTALQEAVRLLASGGPSTRLMAGGQSLLLALKERTLRPAQVLSLAGIAELCGICTGDDGRLEIGATTTYAALARAPLAGWHAEIGAVAGNLADRSVRSLGTVGGGICQAEPRYDMPALLSAAGARLHLVSASGSRTLEASEFFNPAGGTRLAADEILTRISVPAAGTLDALAFEKFRFRAVEAAIVSVACALKLGAGGRIAGARLVVGAVARAPLTATASAAALEGRGIAEVDGARLGVQVAAEVAPPGAGPGTRQRYQSELVVSLTAKAFERARAQSRGQ